MSSFKGTTQAAQLPLKIIWQDGPQSWTGNSTKDFLTLTKQLLALMGNEPNQPWTLVLDIFGPLNQKRVNGSAWTPEMVVYLAKALTSVGMNPSLGYHPAAENYRNDWVKGANPSDQAVQAAMVSDMATFNAALKKADPSLPVFDQFIAEGNDISRNTETFQFIRDQMNKKGLSNSELWSAGSYSNGVTVDGIYSPDRAVPDSGIYSEVYDFYNKTGIPRKIWNPLVNASTNPNDNELGKKIFNAMRIEGNVNIGASQLKHPERAYQIFNFSGANEAKAGHTDSPVFGGMIKTKGGKIIPQPGVMAPGWDLNSFKTMLESYSSAFQSASGESPTMGIWGAENGINFLIPLSSLQDRVKGTFSTASQNDLEQEITINKHQHNAVLLANTKSVTVEIGFSAAYRNGIGFYPLLDATGRILSIGGLILHPMDATYLEEAKKLAKHLDLWKTDPHPGGDSSHRSHLWTISLTPGTRYALIADSAISISGDLYSSISAANPDNKVHFASEFGNSASSLGFEDQINQGDNDFNDITLRITEENNASFSTESVTDKSLLASTTPAPNIDSIWMNGLALDAGTAYQLAELITGHPDNHDLDLVIDVAPPNNFLLNPTAKTHKDKFPTISNDLKQYLTFLNNIDTYVSKLSQGKMQWDGRLIYHPQTEVSEFNATATYKGKTVPTGWAGYKAPVPANTDKTFELTSDITKSYEAYIDWMGAFNQYMSLHQQKTFSEFLFEPQSSQWTKNSELRNLFGPNLARAYKGNPDLFSQGSQPPLAEGEMPFSVTSGSLANWDAKYGRNGFGADGNWAQIYDLLNDAEYDPLWPQANGKQQLNPIDFQADDVINRFNSFFYNKKATTPVEKIYNINRLVTPQADGNNPATSFDPRSHLIFTYSRDAHNDPGFANTFPDGRQWQWDKDDFASVIEGLRTQLPASLNEAAGPSGQFPATANDLNIGVWGSNTALDAWFSIPDPTILGTI